MAVKIRLTERQQKLAAGELDGLDDNNPEGLRDAGFDYVDDGDDSDASDASNSSSQKVSSSARNNSGVDSDLDGIEPSGEYIDDEDGSSSSRNDTGDGTRDDDRSGLPAWVDDKALEYAASYGFSEADLEGFGSFEQLQRVGSLLDRRYAESARKAGDTSGKEVREESSLPGSGKTEQVSGGTKAESQERGSNTGDAGRASGVLSRLKPLDRKRYEEAKYGEAELDLVDQLNATIEAVREFFPAIEQQVHRQRQESQQAEDLEFHQALDELDPELYGQATKDGKVSDKLNPAFLGTRKAVREAMDALRFGIIREAEQLGEQPVIPSTRALAIRAARVLEYQAGSNQPSKPVSREQVAQQSRRRRPVGTGGQSRSGGSSGGSSSKPGAGPVDELKQIVNNPEIARFWKQTQRENGVT